MDPRSRWRALRVFFTFCVLMVAWVAFSADFGAVGLCAGAVSSAVVALLAYGVFIEEHEAGRRAVLPRLIPAFIYPFILIFSMYAAAFKVLGKVITGSVRPGVVHFRSRLRSDLARVVLAEGITFTPGTIVIDLDEDHYVVHWLDAPTRHSTRAGIEVKGPLEAAIRRIWA